MRARLNPLYDRLSPLNGIAARGFPEFRPIIQLMTAVADMCIAPIVAAVAERKAVVQFASGSGQQVESGANRTVFEVERRHQLLHDNDERRRCDCLGVVKQGVVVSPGERTAFLQSGGASDVNEIGTHIQDENARANRAVLICYSHLGARV